MAQIAGKTGSVKLGANTVAELDNWNLSIDVDMLEITKFLDSAKGYIAGLYAWNGKASGRFDQTDATGQAALQTALLNGTTVALKLYVNATNSYSGTAFVKSMNPKASVSGTVEVEFSFQGSGALTYA